MTDATSLAFVFPSAVFGGHEQMACALIERYLQQGVSIGCFGLTENHRLRARLSDLAVDCRPLPVGPMRLESIRALLDRGSVRRATGFLAGVAAEYTDLVLVQGDIETGSIYLTAARRYGLDVVSYLPYFHSFHAMKKPLGRLRDLVNLGVYRGCARYWVISPSSAQKIQTINPRARVTLVENFLSTRPRFTSLVSRPPGEIHFVVVGRMSFAHKGQDIFLRALRTLRVPGGTRVFAHLVGDGHDDLRARALATKAPPGVSVRFHGWLDRWWDSFAPEDVLVIPSRFEGVPLVMLEGRELGLRVLAAARDGMADYLAPAELYAVPNEKAAVRNLGRRLQVLLGNPRPGLSPT